MEVVARAKSRYVKISPTKLRPFIDAIRGKNVGTALIWLRTRPTARALPVIKALNSAWSNAKNHDSSLVEQSSAVVAVAKVDQGPTVKYHRPGSMGRSIVQRRRSSHIEIGVALTAAHSG
jgi:large subunit ribosomal protein L22